MLVKRILREHGYPPDKQEKATQTVLEQAEVLRPYPTFEEWRPEILSAFETYLDLAHPTHVERIGLRYINRIEIPSETFRMEHYFRLYPEVPVELGESHGAFMLRVELDVQPPHKVVATLGAAPPEAVGSSALLLDLYDTVTPPDPARFASVAALVDGAHENVERVFETVITDQARAIRRIGMSAALPLELHYEHVESQDVVRVVVRLLRVDEPSVRGRSVTLGSVTGARGLLGLLGLGKEVWAGVEAQEYANRLRDEWER